LGEIVFVVAVGVACYLAGLVSAAVAALMFGIRRMKEQQQLKSEAVKKLVQDQINRRQALAEAGPNVSPFPGGSN
jgi:hypothetical protein